MSENTQQTILIVDDYEDIRHLLREWLERSGYHVVEAADGKEAVEVARREHPSLILMDLYLPEIDGYVATAQIRRQEALRHVPIVGTSAYGESGVDIQLQIDPLAVGFNAYVAKPFSPEKLAEIVERYVPKSRSAVGV